MMRLTLPSLSCALLALASLPNQVSADELKFEKDIRPILKAHCFHCHGEDGTKKASLDLRLRHFIAKGGETGPAIVPGKPNESLLLQRIVDGEMPPEDKKLSAVEIGRIRTWIVEGAKTAKAEPKTIEEDFVTEAERSFWAFQPIIRPTLPKVTQSNRVNASIDRFVLARLEKEGLTLSPRASRRTLIRRVYFDLLGLPPTPDAVKRFESDTSPDAYSRLVDELLASSHYGERWGRHWLDVAGYADSEGYTESDTERPWAYGYRDYVIRAFNAGMPFDRFVREQLAGDELVKSKLTDLSENEISLLRATGFLRMAPDGTGGGVDQSVARNEVVAATIDVVSTSLLGLTVGCARCHNHRYDPISQKDYYELRAVFEPALDWKSWRPPSARKISLYTKSDREVAKKILAKADAAAKRRQEIIAHHIERTLTEELIKAPENLKQTLRTAYRAKKRSSEQEKLLKEYPNIRNISTGSLYLYAEQRARRAGEISAVAKKKEEAFIAKAKAENPAATVTAETLKNFNPDGAAELASIRKAADICRKTDAKKEMADLQAEVDKIKASVPKEYFVRALTEPSNHTPSTHLFKRGNHQTPGKTVTPGAIDVLHRDGKVEFPVNDTSRPSTGRRLAYAQYLTNGEHPMLARVIANRIWYHHFGRGIVNTPGDFGYLGDRPTHPRLLDWLASELTASGWQLKRLHREILLSHTYQQQSARTPQLDELDPDNRLYARQSIRRLESEAFRDAVLQVTGMLNQRMFGEAIPVMEDGVGQIVIGKEDLDGERKPRANGGLKGEEHRRSLYVQVRRSRPLAVLETFDIATVSPNCNRRPTSNVASQSLLLMNSEFMTAYAAQFAKRVQKEGGLGIQNQLRFAWRLAFNREISKERLASLESFVRAQTHINLKAAKHDRKLAHTRALEVACQALLGANEFIYID